MFLRLRRLRLWLRRLKGPRDRGPGFRAAPFHAWPVKAVMMLAGYFPRYDLFFVMVLAVAFPWLIRY